ncbi:MAG TPA: hypothetical protein VLG11_03095 [Candidatus Saccharimonadales bacterium]|nr:hypothetical protein [Candidatus Saccharimonadales bacterium]
MPTVKQTWGLLRTHGKVAKAYEAHGFGKPPVPLALSQQYFDTMIDILGGAFTPDQFPPVPSIPHLDPGNVSYFTEVQATIQQNAEKPSPETERLGKAYGRWLAAYVDVYPSKRRLETVPKIASKRIFTRAGSAPFETKKGSIIEYGMGINGLLTHRDSLTNKRYRAIHIGASALENLVLDGMADRYSIDESQLVLDDRGITAVTTDLVSGYECCGETDAIIGSYVQGAPDLKEGIYNAPELLRPGGLLVLEGYGQLRGGTGYEAAAETAIQVFGPDAVVADEAFKVISPYGDEQPARSIILQKPEN